MRTGCSGFESLGRSPVAGRDAGGAFGGLPDFEGKRGFTTGFEFECGKGRWNSGGAASGAGTARAVILRAFVWLAGQRRGLAARMHGANLHGAGIARKGGVGCPVHATGGEKYGTQQKRHHREMRDDALPEPVPASPYAPHRKHPAVKAGRNWLSTLCPRSDDPYAHFLRHQRIRPVMDKSTAAMEKMSLIQRHSDQKIVPMCTRRNQVCQLTP